MALCSTRLEVQERRTTEVFTCELPDGHALPHRSLYLAAGLEVARCVEEVGAQDAGPSVDIGAGWKRRPTTDVVLVWK